VKRVPFTVQRDSGDVPAVAWFPEQAAEQRPLVLIGHGGAMHKEAAFVTRLAGWLADGPGYATLAIDLPLHGERTPEEEKGLSPLERRNRQGVDAWRERNAANTDQAVADWRAAIDAVQELDSAAHGPVGYAGLSMGTRFGIPLVASEPRITAAVLGLFGIAADDMESAFAAAARQVSIPVLYLLQWDDELFPRDDGLTLFDLLGTRDKTLHANPGGHLRLPRAEIGNTLEFLRNRLNGRASPGTS
jgi:dienelactone hydrolase